MEEVTGTGKKAMYDDDELAQLLQGRRLAPVTTCDNKTNSQAGQRELDARRVPADVQEQARALVSEHPKGFMAATFGAPTHTHTHVYIYIYIHIICTYGTYACHGGNLRCSDTRNLNPKP